MNDQIAHRLLLACLNTTLTKAEKTAFIELTLDQWSALLALAQKQHVASLFYHHINRHGLHPLLPPYLVAEFDTIYRHQTMRSLKLGHDLVHVLRALQAENIPVIVLKGAYLAQVVYPNSALRYMVDSDIMVHEDDLLAAAEVVMALGYQPIKPIHLECKAYENHLSPFFKPNGTGYLEIHWSITRPNRPYSIASHTLWARAQPFIISDIKTQTLCPEDLLLHLCSHAFHHHRYIYGIRPLYDIAATVAKYGTDSGMGIGIDWDVLCQRSQDWGWSRVVYLTLYLSHTLLGAAIPPQVLAALEPNDMPPEFVEFAQTCLFADEDDVRDTISTNFMRVMGRKSLSDKTKLMMSRLLISREEVANIYHIPINSPKLYFYYPVRLRDFLWSCSQQVWHYLNGGTDFKRQARQFNALVDWMEQA